MRRFENFEMRPGCLPEFRRYRRAFRLRQEFGMPSEIKQVRTVPKYRIFVEVLEACPMVVRAKVQIYEITGHVGQYRQQFELKTSRQVIEAFDRDLESFLVTLPDHVQDLSKTANWERA